MPRLFEILAAARRYRAGGVGPKATLLALTEYMGLNEDGEWTCWPGVKQLAEDTEQDERTVRRHLAVFVNEGLIHQKTRGHTDGGRATNVLVLDIERLGLAGMVSANSGGLTDIRGGGKRTSGDSVPLIEVPRTSIGADKPRKRASVVAEDWKPSDTSRQWAKRENYPDEFVERETAKFIDWNRAKGKPWTNHDAAWKNWMRKAAEMNPDAVKSTRPRVPSFNDFEPGTDTLQYLSVEDNLARLREIRKGIKGGGS